MLHLLFGTIIKKSSRVFGLSGLVGVTLDFLALERLERLERVALHCPQSTQLHIPKGVIYHPLSILISLLIYSLIYR